MKISILTTLLGLMVAFNSCTTVYKAGQTPDDVYSSPAPSEEEYARINKTEDHQYKKYEEDDENDDYDDYDDRYLRMKVRNRYRWSGLDDWYDYGDRYNFSYYNNWSYWNDPFYWNSPWSPVSYWNMYYNPWYSGWGGGFGGGWGYNSWYGGWGGIGWGGGLYDPWYSGWYGYPYYYGYGGGFGTGRQATYGQRRTNLNTYNGKVLNGQRATESRAGYMGNRNTNYMSYGVKDNRSVNTNRYNATSSGRASALRERYNNRPGINNQRVNNRSYNDNDRRIRMPNDSYGRPNTERGSSMPFDGGGGRPSGGGRSSGGGASGRRF